MTKYQNMQRINVQTTDQMILHLLVLGCRILFMSFWYWFSQKYYTNLKGSLYGAKKRRKSSHTKRALIKSLRNFKETGHAQRYHKTCIQTEHVLLRCLCFFSQWLTSATKSKLKNKNKNTQWAMGWNVCICVLEMSLSRTK